jgi:DNA-binding MarR family transcriptional regulator
VASQLTAALQRECGLAITDFEILLRLDAGHGADHGAGQRIGDLTGPIRLSQPALSRAVARLAGRGFLTRSGSPADARCVLVTLTPAGRDVLATAAGVHASVINEALLGRISPAEQEVLARVLARVADG